jgi:hypothetical protein
MMARCYNPKHHEFDRYGARGISVCSEWHDFWSFRAWCLNTFEDGKTVDRSNNDGEYSPSNCRWATPEEQQQTARKTLAKAQAMRDASKLRRPHRKYRARKSNGRFA